MKKKLFWPLVIFFAGIVLIIIGAFIKVQGSESGLLLWIGLLMELAALVLLIVNYFGKKD